MVHRRAVLRGDITAPRCTTKSWKKKTDTTHPGRVVVLRPLVRAPENSLTKCAVKMLVLSDETESEGKVTLHEPNSSFGTLTLLLLLCRHLNCRPAAPTEGWWDRERRNKYKLIEMVNHTVS